MRSMGIFILLFLIVLAIPVYAEEPSVSPEQTQQIQDWIADYDFRELEAFIRENLQFSAVSFGDLVRQAIFEPEEFSLKEWGNRLTDCFWGQAAESRKQAAMLLVLMISAAVFISFTESFENAATAAQAWFVIYLMLSGIMLAGFQRSFTFVRQYLELILLFMKLLLPSLCLSMVCIFGAAASGLCYQVTFLMITGVNYLFVYGILPLIQLHFALSLLNGLGKRDRFSGMIDLIQTLYDWMMKTLMAGIVGLQAIQALILPMAAKSGPMLFQRLLSAIPGIGSGVRSAAEILTGTGILVKNGIGTAGCIVLILFGSNPVIQLAVSVLVYYLVGAVVSPVGDERMKKCMQAFTQSNRMLLKTLCMVLFLFFITIAVICVCTNGML